MCDQVKLESVFAAIREKFSGKVAEGNVAAAREAYEIVDEGARGGQSCLKLISIVCVRCVVAKSVDC